MPLLLEHGASPAIKSAEGETALDWARKYNNPEVMRVLGAPVSKPGALLSRKWKERTILVEVLAEGFRYENRHYPSLSAIAVAVTGTRWNGLAFFGLTRPVSGERKERSRAQK